MGYYSGHDADEDEKVGPVIPESLIAATDILRKEKTAAEASRVREAPIAGESGDKPLGIARYQTLIASYIFGTLAPEWEAEFEKRNAEYGEYDDELGPLGEAVEVWRKAKKLKRAFIERVDTSEWAETPREVAMDMIGHLYLLISTLDERDNEH